MAEIFAEKKVVKLWIFFLIKVECRVAKIKGRVLLKSQKIQFHDMSVRGKYVWNN